MKRVVVASQNPVKIRCAEAGFERMFPGEQWEMSGVGVESGVSEQPMNDEETLQGAFNRMHAARLAEPVADFYVGIEGGVEVIDGEMECFAWIVVMDREGRVGRGRTASFFLPSTVKELVVQGMELADADNKVFGRENSKQANGCVGFLTDDVIDRMEYYAHAVVLALIPFKNGNYYL